VYAVGADVLSDELEAVGFNVLSSSGKHTQKYDGFDYHNDNRVPFDPDVDAVVMGYDD